MRINYFIYNISIYTQKNSDGIKVSHQFKIYNKKSIMAPAKAQDCVKTCIQRINDKFEGLDEAFVEEFYEIMLPAVREFEAEVRRECLAQAAAGVQVEPEKPKLKRWNNYQLFGKHFREENPDKKDFSDQSAAWAKLSDEEKEEWSRKAKDLNAELLEAYRKEHGEPPKKGKKLPKNPKKTYGYRVFGNEFREKNKSKIAVKDMFSAAKKAWDKLSKKQQEKYQEQAEKLNEQYREEHEKYLAEHPEIQALIEAQAGGKRKKKEKKLRPNTVSGYRLFGVDFRKKSTAKGKEVMKEQGAAWSALNEREQKKYNDRAEKENKKIVADFVKTNPECEWVQSHPQTA